MWKTINDILVNIDNLVWGIPLMVLILAGGILLTVRNPSYGKTWSFTGKKTTACPKMDGKKRRRRRGRNFKFFCPLYSPKRDDWNR